MRIIDADMLDEARRRGLDKFKPNRPRIAVGMGTCGIGNGAEDVYNELAAQIDARGLDVALARTGCFGFCAEEPLVNIMIPGRPLVIRRRVTPRDVTMILDDIHQDRFTPDGVLCKIEAWDHLTAHITYGRRSYAEVPLWNELPFYKWQKKIVLRNCGLICPDDIDEYLAVGGYQALYRALHELRPEDVIEELKLARLRGRGGAGFQTATKWEMMRKAPADGPKYVICNADEGDPGAYMNRNELEGDPHNLIEGMIIGAYVMGAGEGIVYIRAEYPLAVMRLRAAIEQARELGLLGENILGSGFNFDLRLVEGAGAFVCGEETALIASLEGLAGRPRPRPPFPSQKGLWGRPTNINNVETWYNVPVIVQRGAPWFLETGTASSPGTKVFSLVGKVKNTGLVEIPLGTSLRKFVYDIGEGSSSGRAVRAVQTGGPSGGCIPAEKFETAVDFESLSALGSIMGSGGMVVMDEDNCMVDVARYFLEFTHSESCGKCIPCRAGLDQMLRILNDITQGKATLADLDRLEELGPMIRDTSLCGLGQTAPNPVRTTLRYFREDYENHIAGHRCEAGVCETLFLAPCENRCPLHMNIPRFIQLFNEGRLEEAFLSVILDNPLPASTGRVCQHPCDNRCRRAGLDEAVNMREIHRFIADSVYGTAIEERVVARLLALKRPPTGKRVAVVGAGPTGLTAGFYLALMGHEVTIFEAAPEPGGMLRYALPEYRLPRRVLELEVRLIQRMGVAIKCNTPVGESPTHYELRQAHDSVFLSVGTWHALPLDIPGSRLGGVIHALDFLEQVAHGKPIRLGRKVLVVGGGNAAIDSARTALRMGAEEVQIVYRRQKRDMPAIVDEIEEALEEGAKLITMVAPHRLVGDERGQVKALEIQKTIAGEFDSSGRRRPIPTDEINRLSADTVILAIGERVDPIFSSRSGLRLNHDGTIGIDRYSMETSQEGVFAGGDLVTGASNVSNAMSFGKRAARSIDKRLTGLDRFEELFPDFIYEQAVPAEPAADPRARSAVMPAAERVRCNDEVMLGYARRQAEVESHRCLRCDVGRNGNS